MAGALAGVEEESASLVIMCDFQASLTLRGKRAYTYDAPLDTGESELADPFEGSHEQDQSRKSGR